MLHFPSSTCVKLVMVAKFFITCFLSTEDTLTAELSPRLIGGLVFLLTVVVVVVAVVTVSRLSHDPLKMSTDDSDWLLAMLSHWSELCLALNKSGDIAFLTLRL